MRFILYLLENIVIIGYLLHQSLKKNYIVNIKNNKKLVRYKLANFEKYVDIITAQTIQY